MEIINKCTFDFPTLSVDDCKAFCRLNKAQINALGDRSGIDKTKLLIFYTICFRNIPNAFSKIIFGKSYGHISKIFRDVLNALHCNFVPNKLNTGWDRIKIKNDTRGIFIILSQPYLYLHVKDLYLLTDDQTLLMTDGVMIYVPKSGQFHYLQKFLFTQLHCLCLFIWK